MHVSLQVIQDAESVKGDGEHDAFAIIVPMASASLILRSWCKHCYLQSAMSDLYVFNGESGFSRIRS